MISWHDVFYQASGLAAILFGIWRVFVVERKVLEVHLTLNSRLDQLLRSVEQRGVSTGRQQVLDEQRVVNSRTVGE